MSKYGALNKHNGDFEAVLGRSRYNGKGGGGGGDNYRPATAQEMRLWTAQAKALEGMTNLSMPMLETGYNNLGTMANESMDGTLSTRMRGLASADANQSMSTGLHAATRSLDRYGSTMNPNALGAQVNNAGIEGAKLRSDVMNKANFAAEDTKWQRNQALTSLASGQGNSAVSGMGSLASQIGGDRASSNNMAAQNAAGYGAATGTLLATGLKGGLSAKTGGYIKDGELHLASGGLAMYPKVSSGWKPINLGSFSGQEAPTDQGANAIMPTVTTALMADKFLNDGDGLKAAKSAVRGWLKPTAKGEVPYTGGEDAVNGLDLASDAVTKSVTPEAISAAELGAPATEAAVNTGVNMAADAAGLAAPSVAAAETAAAVTAAETAAAATAAEAAIPEALSLLLLKDGGSVNKGLRKDMRGGGKVKGKGTSTSDSIPAKLSDGEYVLNAEAVNIVGKDKLDKINQAGLRRRLSKGA